VFFSPNRDKVVESKLTKTIKVIEEKTSDSPPQTRFKVIRECILLYSTRMDFILKSKKHKYSGRLTENKKSKRKKNQKALE
jgi:hypothetical protein